MLLSKAVFVLFVPLWDNKKDKCRLSCFAEHRIDEMIPIFCKAEKNPLLSVQPVQSVFKKSAFKKAPISVPKSLSTTLNQMCKTNPIKHHFLSGKTP